ncbi:MULTISPECIES: lipid-A-disaccharide synthase [unclassified Hyphomonas]|uniref:lipid-A-disaccharide synthase n=1 Tax=unclassified Hyphomonas TaxID=2630699 RepID=UPI000C4425D7|nr:MULTISPECIES: lipid-A-disaccharide synthase [unclassified Hyphomonas]MAA83107.1 lipid-A-disaccharide synthase [Hyphomonas sp.]MAN89411.1 lipid-A-disaccharide synthase [Hyphomonadaceae bacterium]HBL93585.1 lipid-A-disaccharide synthase [Hyphomonas sp.]HCN92544.1 lipid-A-disaccharide synthase [Hyphomonas sp.]
MSAPRIYMVAAETSGDLLAREVVEDIRRRNPDAHISGIGGGELASVGIESAIDISPLSILGFVEGLRAYGDVVRLADAAADAIIADDPDVVVLVDSWGFMLRVAQRVRLRAPNIRLVKLVGPQVWATRPGRAKTLASVVDHLLCIHDLEVPFYEPFGLKTTVIGNPAISRHVQGNGSSFRAGQSIPEDTKLVLVLPGSRPSEIKRVAPELVSAAKALKSNDPNLKIVFMPASNVATQFREDFPGVASWSIVSSDPGARYDAMAAADLALACSGTVTTELAMQDTPMIVAYKTGWITWALARGLLYSKTHITLLNIVSDDQPIVPEFVQTQQKADLIAAAAQDWFTDPDKLLAQLNRQRIALDRMKEGDRDASEIAAGVILDEAAARSAGSISLQS